MVVERRHPRLVVLVNDTSPTAYSLAGLQDAENPVTNNQKTTFGPICPTTLAFQSIDATNIAY